MTKTKRRKLISSLLVAYTIVLAVNLAGNYRYYAAGNDWKFSIGFCLAVTTLGWLGFMLVPEPLIRRAINWKKYPIAGLAFSVLVCGAYGVILMVTFIKVMVWLRISNDPGINEYVNDATYSALFSMLIGLIFTGYEFLKRWKKGMEDNERMNAEMIRSQYEVLKIQVNPHFLFNSLNTLAAIIPEKPAIAVDFVQQLAKVFRYSLQHSEENTTTLAEEMKIVNAYIFLNKQRFDDKLQAKIDIDSSASGKTVITQSVLMLVENAIKHNEISTLSPLIISIYNEGDMMVIKNNLQPKHIVETSTHIGLQNIRSRYSLVTDRPVEVAQDKNSFTVKIPLLSK